MENAYKWKLVCDTKEYTSNITEAQIEAEELRQTIKETQKALQKATPGSDFYNTLMKDLIESKNALKDMEKSAKETTDAMSKSFGGVLTRGIKKIGKMALAVFGIRTAFNFIRKSISTLAQTNEQLKTDLNYISFAMAKTIEPIVNWLINAVMQILGFIGKIVYKMSGFNIFSKATSKDFKDMNKNAKALNKSLSSFDTITNLTNSGGNLSPSIDLAEISTDTEVFNKKWSDAVYKFRDDWSTVLQENKKSMDWWLGEQGWSKGFRFAVGRVNDGLNTTMQGMTNIIGGVLDVIEGIITGDVEQIKDGIIIIFIGLMQSIYGIIKVSLWSVLSFIAEIGNSIYLVFKAVFYDLIWKQILVPIFSSIGEVFDTMFLGIPKSVGQIWDGIKKIFNGDIKEGFKTIGKGIGNVFITILNTVISTLNVVWTGILAIADAVGSIAGKKWNLKTKLAIPKIPMLNVGTNYVPQDTLAVLHKGEAVVPKKFNSETYFNQGNEETNRLLNELIVTLENKDMNAYISKEQVGQASVDYIKQKERIMGRSIL